MTDDDTGLMQATFPGLGNLSALWPANDNPYPVTAAMPA